MPMLPSRHYNSEANAFLRDFIEQHPEVVQKQKEGASLWWNHDAEAVQAQREADWHSKEDFQENENQ